MNTETEIIFALSNKSFDRIMCISSAIDQDHMERKIASLNAYYDLYVRHDFKLHAHVTVLKSVQASALINSNSMLHLINQDRSFYVSTADDMPTYAMVNLVFDAIKTTSAEHQAALD